MSTSSSADTAKLRRPRLPGYLHMSDIQGLAQLATQGTLGVAGLVPLEGALGQNAEPRPCLAFATEKQWIAYGVNHLELLNRPEVGRQLVRWLGP